MKQDIKDLKEVAEIAKKMYQFGRIERNIAKAMIMPYLNAVNKKSIELAKKYNQKPKKVSFCAYVR